MKGTPIGLTARKFDDSPRSFRGSEKSSEVGHLAPDAYQLQGLHALQADWELKVSEVERDCQLKISKYEMDARRNRVESSYNRWMDSTYVPHTSLLYLVP